MPTNVSSVSGRLGVLGGTFDPVHVAHTELAKQAIEQCELSHLMVIPCALPPHKDCAQASNSQRMAMLELAFSNLPNVQLCDYELNKASTSYTVETLEFLSEQFSDAELFFCLGEDSLRNFTSWHRWQDILSMAHLAVMKRQTTETEQHNELDNSGLNDRKIDSVEEINRPAGQIIEIFASDMAVSATAIREQIKQCSSCPDKQMTEDSLLSTWLDPRVLGYIVDNKVYQ